MEKFIRFFIRTLVLTSVFTSSFIAVSFAQTGNVTQSKAVVYFKSGKSKLTIKYRKILATYINAANEKSLYSIAISGYTDNVGSAKYNLKLSHARALHVAAFVKKYIVPSDYAKIKINWHGKANPVNSNAGNNGRAANRRVEIVLERNENTILDKVVDNNLTIDELYTQLSEKPQIFCIDNNRDTTLVAKQGTIVYIKAHTIQLPESTYCSPCITIEIKEALNKSDIFKENLTTTCGNKILVSQSMVYVGFKCGEASLSLKPGDDYVIMAPTNQPVKASRIFNGQAVQLPNHFDWKTDDKSVLTTLSAKDVHNCFYPDDGNGFITNTCKNCRFVFCGMGKWIKGVFNKDSMVASRQNIQCRREYRAAQKLAKMANRSQKKWAQGAGLSQATRDSLVALYYKNRNELPDIDTCERLLDACERIKCHAAQVAIHDSLITEDLIRRSADNANANNNPIGYADLNKLKYSVYSSSKTGWSNIDWMMALSDSAFEPINVMLAPNNYTDCKIILKGGRTVLVGLRNEKDRFTIPLIPKGLPAWLVMVNTETNNGKISVEIRSILTGAQTITPVFKEVDLKTFVGMLDQLNQ